MPSKATIKQLDTTNPKLGVNATNFQVITAILLTTCNKSKSRHDFKDADLRSTPGKKFYCCYIPYFLAPKEMRI